MSFDNRKSNEKQSAKLKQELKHKKVILDALSRCPKKSDRKAIIKSEDLSSVIEKSDEQLCHYINTILN